ncbi:MAG: ferritin-like domain-containing protein [Chloroflexota bacterium]|nr:ferritin-like domain-containing protein [Chloroflexota bacterium]
MIDDIAGFLEVGRSLENAGASAYIGAATSIKPPDVLKVALSVYGVEARHAAYLN